MLSSEHTRRTALAILLALILIATSCGRTESPAVLLSRIKDSDFGEENMEIWVKPLICTAPSQGVTTGYPTNKGGRIANVVGQETVPVADVPWDRGGGNALVRSGSSLFYATLAGYGRRLIVGSGGADAWDEKSWSVKQEETVLDWPALVPQPDGKAVLLCWMRGPDLKLGIYRIPVARPGEPPQFVRPLIPLPVAKYGFGEGAFVSLGPVRGTGSTTYQWSVAFVEGDEREPVTGPPEAHMATEAVADREGRVFILWERLSGRRPRGLLVSRVREGMVTTRKVAPQTPDYLTTLVLLPEGGVGTVGYDDGDFVISRWQDGTDGFQPERLCKASVLIPDRGHRGEIACGSVHALLTESGALHLLFATVNRNAADVKVWHKVFWDDETEHFQVRPLTTIGVPRSGEREQE